MKNLSQRRVRLKCFDFLPDFVSQRNIKRNKGIRNRQLKVKQ